MVSTRAVRLTLAGLAGLILAGLGAALDAERKMIPVAHIGGSPNDLRVKSGNDAAVKAYRDGTLTGGWGFAQFVGGKPADEAVHKTCFPCHEPAKGRDFVFTRYAP